MVSTVLKFFNWRLAKKVIKIINQIQKKNKTPILVGGTGLYFSYFEWFGKNSYDTS